MTALDFLQRERQLCRLCPLPNWKRSGKACAKLESSHSVTEAALLAVRCNLCCLHSALVSANRWEFEVTELAAEITSVRSVSETTLEVRYRAFWPEMNWQLGDTGKRLIQ
jgi:hypothetical protein